MKLVIQRARSANVKVNDKIVGKIGLGMVVFTAIEYTDNETTIKKIVQKLLKLRIFSTDDGKMNLNVQNIDGGILLISQFTLSANLNNGNRPSFNTGIEPEAAKKLFEHFVVEMQKAHHKVAQGIFAADMKVLIDNDGPATFLINIE
jgi:D-tyrosyl-tRNA(Tyr) deacylase